MIHLYREQPTATIAGFRVRTGNFAQNGAYPVAEGVNFTIHSHYATSCELVLFHNSETVPYARIPFPSFCRIGDVYSMIVYDLDIENFEYCYSFDGPYEPEKGHRFQKKNMILDPYAKAVVGQRVWGERYVEGDFYKARVVRNDYDWGLFKQSDIPFEDLVIYEMHVRGFTKDESSHVKYPGTFAGIREKIPYLKELGINAIEMMPIFCFDEMEDNRHNDGKRLYNYWGYNTVCFFAPNTAYSAHDTHGREGTELKKLIRELNANGIEVILDVVFNHTAEGNEHGRTFCFKGIDNKIYYMLTPEGYYYNFSGCGNAMNCNHPIVQQMIVECLRYWVTEYRVNGFRFDLASILGRDQNGAPMEDPPLLKELARDPILAKTKLIAEAWDAGGLYQVGNFPAYRRWAEWNGKYRDDVRQFLKGDDGKAGDAINRITGSTDLYHPEHRGDNASINFLNCHDGFTLYDMYAYNTKHNEANGWNNTDGSNDNRSWNCGVEGETVADYDDGQWFDEDGQWNSADQEQHDAHWDYLDEYEPSGESPYITFAEEPQLDEQGTFWFQLDESGNENASDVSAMVYEISGDGEDLIVLGETRDVVGDWDTGIFHDDFDGYWLSLPDGQNLSIYLIDVTDDYNLYTATILLNGEETNLRMKQLFEDGSVVIEGTWDGIDDNGSADRNIIPLEEGDVIVPTYTAYSMEGEEEFTYTGSEYTVDSETAVYYDLMEPADYRYLFSISDIYGDYYLTGAVQFSVNEDGSISFQIP